MPLTVFNTLTRQKEIFQPMVEGRVGIYVCGPTVYGDSHLGHAKSYISFDVIVRYLRYCRYEVLYVQNITDVGHLTGDADEGEDKIEKQSRKDRVHPMQVAETFTRSYFEDMDALNVLRADISPRATGHITEQIEIIKRLVDKGAAYAVNGSVYFDVGTFADYGKLSGRSVGEMEAGARVQVNPEKRHPADFALWKKAEPGHIMKWPSPWGVGFPGWHIECSAMSMKYLGESFDIHGGGLENQFPHHECEIAQSEAATGMPFARYWLHNNMVTVESQKMGKSLGNFVTLKDAFKRWRPQGIRFFVLQSHYRSPLDFSDDAVDGAAKGLEKLTNTMRALRERISDTTEAGSPSGIDLNTYKAAFLDAMNDDFNTPQAIAVLFDLTKEVNRLLVSGEAFDVRSLREIEACVEELSGILGVTLGEEVAGGAPAAQLEAGLMQVIIDVRKELRAQKLWPIADKIRDGLGHLGIVLEDRKKDETGWKKVH